MAVTVIANPKAEHQCQSADAIITGLQALSIRTGRSTFAATTKQVVCWGWSRGQALRQRGHDVLVIERGYIGDRTHWHSLGWNGLNGRAKMPDIDDPQRYQVNFGGIPDYSDGDYILLIGQVPGDMSLQGKDLKPWCAQTAKAAERAYGLPVVFRPHPVSVERGLVQGISGVETDLGDLQESLDGAALVITWNSNTAVDALLAGKPALTFDAGSMAWDVSGHEVGDMLFLDRSEWAAKLACKQWTLDEIASGNALEVLFQCR